MMDAKPGDSCSNDHFSDRFTCPNCYTDHTVSTGCRNGGKIIECECGAKLRCEVETFESSVCTVADLDELTDAD
jgi:transcription elongation factor Elf1